MIGIRFRAWHKKEGRMYYAAYQKLLHVLLCDDDRGANGGKGTPVRRASFEDVEMMQSTGLYDDRGHEIFEGDRLKLTYKGREYTGVVPEIPDMYKSRGLHPFQTLLEKHSIPPGDDFGIEIVGNRYENG